MVNCGTLTVQQPMADIGVQSCQTSPSSGSTVGTDQTVGITVTLENTGDSGGQVTLTFIANGQPIASRSVFVSAGGTEQVTETLTPSDVGSPQSLSTSVEFAQATGSREEGGALGLADGGHVLGLRRLANCDTCGA